MKNSIGSNVILTIFGESHGPAIGAVLDGMPAGTPVDEKFIAKQMKKRQGENALSTARRESDEVKILSGVFNGFTTGTPIAFAIENKQQKSRDYSELSVLARPSHADYTAEVKYGGFQDFRGGGHFSGRITAGIVAAGAVCLNALKERGINVGAHVKQCFNVFDRDFEVLEKDFKLLDELTLPVLNDEKRQQMREIITQKRSEGDSVGGVVECAVTGLKAGIGEPWFDGLEGMLAKAMFAIPAVKGVEFGAGFGFAGLTGSEANDELFAENGKILTETNNNGGINGGISNGMPITFKIAVKPTPSIYKKQNTVNIKTKENAELEIAGRHDPAIVHRAAVVVQSMAAIVICDALF